ncbi:MAG: transcriptional regulator [Methylobacter sp.]|nr:MAG: transcriptional regulator [Methylobacter sp.]PPD04910.1 MAG: transcriptional regulator [Methylobacter sp.]PPD23701.1 MAG: transcriptional regulator [Methylobacter sp.]PPD32533.1 MAG: transcriptional regulator [Methylomonas sp.]
MHFKLIIAFVDENKTDLVLDTARKHGAKGATVINHARGEGIKQAKTFFGLALEAPRDVLMFLVEEHLSRHILEQIARTAEFDSKPGTGIAFKIDVEDAIGVMHQVKELTNELVNDI